jgi:large subunit ribosomal protein L15
MKKNVTKFRGSRTCGGGTSKNRRGGGSRGGRGNAGGCKHHFVRNYLNGLAYGKHGFKRPQKMLTYTPIVNVGELDELAEQLVSDGQAQKEGDVYYMNLAELDIDKVLGGGMVTKSMVLTVSQCSEKARNKVEEAGGSVVEYVPSEMEPLPEPEEPLEQAVEEAD